MDCLFCGNKTIHQSYDLNFHCVPCFAYFVYGKNTSDVYQLWYYFNGYCVCYLLDYGKCIIRNDDTWELLVKFQTKELIITPFNFADKIQTILTFQ